MNIAQNCYMEWLEGEEIRAQQQVRTYRDYYDGDPPSLLTDRMAAFLSLKRQEGFGANICAPVVDAMVERLQVTGFDVVPDGVDEEQAASVAESLAPLLDKWWAKNRMDAAQSWVHRAALRDREAFIIIGYDAERGIPTLDHDYAYDGASGVKVHYMPGTYNRVAFASKRWRMSSDMARMNLYFPNRIEKWCNKMTTDSHHYDAFWMPYEDAKDETLMMMTMKDDNGKEYQCSMSWWTDDMTETGEPLGVPVIPFINRNDGTGRGLSEIDNIIPMQDALNKTLIDMLASSDMTGFGMYWYTGEEPSGGWKVYPGAMLRLVPDGDTPPSMGQLAAGNVTGLIEQWNTILSAVAAISATPQSRFTPAVVRPAEGTQKQEEGALVAKCREAQMAWGNRWEDIMAMCARVANAFGEEAVDMEGVTISAHWRDAEVRNELEHITAVATKVEKVGLPLEQAWRELDYSATEIRDFKRTKTRQMAEALLEQMKAKAKPVKPSPEAVPPTSAEGETQSETEYNDNGEQGQPAPAGRTAGTGRRRANAGG